MDLAIGADGQERGWTIGFAIASAIFMVLSYIFALLALSYKANGNPSALS